MNNMGDLKDVCLLEIVRCHVSGGWCPYGRPRCFLARAAHALADVLVEELRQGKSDHNLIRTNHHAEFIGSGPNTLHELLRAAFNHYSISELAGSLIPS
jgi:hypothetical protein